MVPTPVGVEELSYQNAVINSQRPLLRFLRSEAALIPRLTVAPEMHPWDEFGAVTKLKRSVNWHLCRKQSFLLRAWGRFMGETELLITIRVLEEPARGRLLGIAFSSLAWHFS